MCVNSYMMTDDLEVTSFSNASICIVYFQNEFWWASEPVPVAGRIIDWCAFNKGLDLEELFKKPIVVRDT